MKRVIKQTVKMDDLGNNYVKDHYLDFVHAMVFSLCILVNASLAKWKLL